MTCIQNINLVLLLAAAIDIGSSPFSNNICLETPSVCGSNIVENGSVVFYGNWISCKLESYSGGKTWQPEMGSPKRKFKISYTTRPIVLKFTGHIGPGMVFWSVKYRDCGLKFEGDTQQTKFTFLNFRKFVSPTILKIKFQRRVLNKAGVCCHLIAHHIWHYCIWWWNYWIKTKRDHILQILFLNQNNQDSHC